MYSLRSASSFIASPTPKLGFSDKKVGIWVVRLRSTSNLGQIKIKAAAWRDRQIVDSECDSSSGKNCPVMSTIGKSTNIVWHDCPVGKLERQALLKQKGCVVWITGLSGSGKSTLACSLSRELHSMGYLTYVLDGDNVRHGLNRDLGFKAEDRAENIRRVGEVAKLFADAGVICIASLISPYRRDRDACRALLPESNFIEVFMDMPIEICESRDPKGLYKLARAGKIKGFTGVDDPYEEPLNCEVVLVVWITTKKIVTMSEPVEPSNHSVTQSSSTQPEKVEINALGVPVSKNAGKISSQIGKLVRIHVPISYENWINVPDKYKMDVWKELLTFFGLDPESKDLILKKMSESFMKHKSDLRARYYDKYDNDEDRLKNCPLTIKQEDWVMFVKNEATPNAKERRDKGKRNRSLYSYGHHTGRTSHVVIEHEMASENPTNEITRREVWERAHTKMDGTISNSAYAYFEKIAMAKELVDDGDEEDLTLDEDIISQVFGKDKKGRTQSIGAKISRTQVKASNIARKQLKKVQGSPENFNSRMDNMEGKLNSILNLMEGRYGGQQNHTSDIAVNEGGSGTRHESVGRMSNNNFPNSLNLSSLSNQKCEITNIDLDIIATTSVCRDSTASIIH